MDLVNETGEEIVITKRNRPVAMLVPVPAAELRPFVGRSRGVIHASREDLLAPLRPVLVYLERRDAAATFRSTAAERGAAWTAPTVAIITDSPNARRHGLRGVRGALRWIAMYKEFLDAMRAASRLPTVVLDDGAPWDARYAAIRVFLGV